MGRILYSKNIPFSLSDWEKEDICKVYAGMDCVMAITGEGRVLQKVSQDDIAARTQYWTRICDIAISGCIPGMALGLVEDGTCMIAKKPLRNCFRDAPWLFDTVNNAVKSWRNICQVAASDGLFALDREGRVHYVNLHPGRDDYADTAGWENVARLVTGTQNSLFGITRDGKVLCAGGNCTRGPKGDMRRKLDPLKGVRDLCAAGSECERVLLAMENGSVLTPEGEIWDVTPHSGLPVLMGNFLLSVLRDEHGHLHWMEYGMPLPENFGKWENAAVVSFGVGSAGCREPFLVAVTEEKKPGLFRFFG